MLDQNQSRIETLIAPSLEAMGYGIVRIMLFGEKRRTLQIMIERLDHQNVTIDDCVNVSHTVSALLDVEDPISESYNLEVSSPGLDRPLVKLADFQRFEGKPARVESWQLIDGRKRFEGRLKGIDAQDIIILESLDTPETTYHIPFTSIRKAKLLEENLSKSLKLPKGKKGKIS